MACTLTVRDAMNFCSPFIKTQPLQVSNMQPAIGIGNIVLSTLVNPPLRWRFNRKNISFAISNLGTDFVQNIQDLGFIETQWLTDGTNLHALGGAISLSVEGASGRPERVAPQYDDNAGNITFRFDKVPDKNYTVFLDYQKKAQLITSPASEWFPIPDEFNHTYHYGFLSLAALLVNDSRFPIFENYFIARIMGLQDGLSDQERNIFIGNWTALTQSLKRADGMVTQGIAGRGK